MVDSPEIQRKIKEIEAELLRTQKNKATEYHIGVQKAKIAKLKRESFAPSRKSIKGGFDIKKEGDATVVIIGFPSVGKSTLLNKLTNAKSEVAFYEFTTLTCIPGIMKYKDAYIQLLDLPGIIEGAAEGRGRGKEIISVARKSDLILALLDIDKAESQYNKIVGELEEFGLRLNKKPKNIRIERVISGGIEIQSSPVFLRTISKNEIVAVLNEYAIYHANVVLQEMITVNDLIDHLESNRVYIPTLAVINKIDKGKVKKVNIEYVGISAEEDIGLDKLRDAMYRKLQFIRIFTKRRGEKADLEEALIMRRGHAIEDICTRLHKDLKKNFRYALIWGKSAKHPGQRVGLKHLLEDGDIVQIYTK